MTDVSETMLAKSVSYFLIVMLSLVGVYSQGCATQTIGENCAPTNETISEPLCEGGCLHGVCAATNTCRCYSGYKLVDGACQPVCTKPCENGTCTAPETCECNPGYHKRMYSYLHTTSCEPHCLGGCPLNSHCDAPGRCKCNPGWRWSENYNNKCEAECGYPCGNGFCVLPDRCLCAKGFQVNYSIQYGYANGQVCERISKGYEGDNWGVTIKIAGKPISHSNEKSTTTTRSPLKLQSTYDYYKNRDENASTTTTVSYVVSSSSSTVMVVNDVLNVTSAQKSWMQQHGMFIWIPLAVALTAGLIMLIVWQRIPMIIIHYFKRKSYNVQGAFLNRNGSGSYEALHFITNER